MPSRLAPCCLTKKFNEPVDQPFAVPAPSFLAIIPARLTALPEPFASRDANTKLVVPWSTPLWLYNARAGIDALSPAPV